MGSASSSSSRGNNVMIMMMSYASRFLWILMMLIVVVNIRHSRCQAAGEMFIFNYRCSRESFGLRDIRYRCVDDLLTNLAGSKFFPPGTGDLNIDEPCFGWPMYGHRWVDMSKPAAAECLQQAAEVIKKSCFYSEGADVSSGDTCRMRYELYRF